MVNDPRELEGGLKDERFPAVAAAGPGHGAARGDAPAAVFLVAQERGEAGRGIDARQAEPINGSVEGDQGGRPHVGDEAVVLDPQAHGRTRVTSRLP